MDPLVLTAIVGPIVTASALLISQRQTSRATDRREANRLEQERQIKEAELDAARAARLRDERIIAYRKLLAATTSAHVDRATVEALSEASAEISLLAGSPELDQAAQRVWVRFAATQKSGEDMRKKPQEVSEGGFAQALSRAGDAKRKFLELARKELQIEQ